MLEVKLKKTKDNAIVPNYEHDGDSGMSLYSTENYILKSGERRIFNTGFKLEIPFGYEAQVRPRSGLAIKYGITVLNTPGTIDSGYRGDVGVILMNLSQEDYKIKERDKIAQLVFQKVEKANLEKVVTLTETVRGKGGFGSTDIKEDRI